MRRSSIAALADLLERDDLRGKVAHVVILHDDGCTPSQCVCNPDFIVEAGTPENIERGARGQREWIRRTTS